MNDESRQRYLELTHPYAPWEEWEDAVLFVHDKMEQDGGHDWSHLARVFANARAIFEEEYDSQNSEELRQESWRILSLAALCHDVVNLPKDDPRRAQASRMAADLTQDWLSSLTWWTAPRLARLVDAIAAHSFSSGLTPETLEGQILSDADKMDALGALGIARTFAVGGRLSRPIANEVDPLATQRDPNDSVSSLDHFFVKLLHLRERMFTPTGRALATQRHDYMQAFVEQLGRELAGGHVTPPTRR